jgi:hypothetical protein
VPTFILCAVIFWGGILVGFLSRALFVRGKFSGPAGKEGRTIKQKRKDEGQLICWLD